MKARGSGRASFDGCHRCPEAGGCDVLLVLGGRCGDEKSGESVASEYMQDFWKVRSVVGLVTPAPAH